MPIWAVDDCLAAHARIRQIARFVSTVLWSGCMSERVCVYVTLFGQYEDLLEQPIFADSAVDFICITDDPELESDSWQIRVVQPVIVTDPARSSRYPKICPHRFLEDYDVSLYIDNSVLLTRTPEEIVSALLPDGAGFSAVEAQLQGDGAR